MAEPTNPREDWLTIIGAKNAITVTPYVPSSDSFGTAIPCSGHHGPRRVEVVNSGEGEVRITRATWFLAGDLLTTRPPLRSKITSGSEVWIVQSWNPDARDAVFTAETTLV